METDTTVLFLHGAGTGAWVWDRVLERCPLPALALDVPGRKAGVTPDGCAAEIAAELDRRGVGSVVAVLHSLAGVLAPGLAARIGHRLQRIVYVSAVIPPAGGSFIDALGLGERIVLRLLFALNRKGLKPSPAMIRRELCNDLSDRDADAVISRYAAEMPGLYLAPVASPPPQVDSVFVRLMRDRSVPVRLQDRMLRRLSAPRVREIDAGHLVMLSTPEELARIVREEVRVPG